jgi:hypothetical protein
MKVVRGSGKPETAMSGVAAYPASGSYVDVSGYEFVHIIAHLGTLHASDTPVLEPKCSDAANGTLDVISATLAHTCDVTNDDGDDVVWSIQVNKLPLDHHFLALAISGTLTNGSYVDVTFLLEGGAQPVTQPATSAATYAWLG